MNRCLHIIEAKKNGGCSIKTLLNSIHSIAAIEPCYGKEGGNATRIYTNCGKVMDDRRRVRTVVQNVCKYFGCDLILLRKSYGEYLGCSQSVPLPLSLNLVLVPVKMRCPQFEKDGALGFLNLCAVKDVVDLEGESEAGKCRVLLEGGLSITVFYSKRCVENRLAKGRMALTCFSARQGHGADQVRERLSSDVAEKLAAKFSRLFYELLADH